MFSEREKGAFAPLIPAAKPFNFPPHSLYLAYDSPLFFPCEKKSENSNDLSCKTLTFLLEYLCYVT